MECHLPLPRIECNQVPKMSYSIYLYRMSVSGEINEDSISDEDFSEVQEVLKRWGWDGHEPKPFFQTPEGWDVEVRGTLTAGQFCGLYLNIWDLNPEICQLVLEIAKAGRFTITHDGNEETPIIIDEAQRSDLPPAWSENSDFFICTTPTQLEAAIDGGFGKWAGYKASLGF